MSIWSRTESSGSSTDEVGAHHRVGALRPIQLATDPVSDRPQGLMWTPQYDSSTHIGKLTV